MKVLFIFILPSGGMNTLNRLRVRALRSRGIEGHLLYFQTGSGSGDIEPDIPVFYSSDPGEIGRILQVHRYDAVVMTSFFLQLPMLRSLGYAGKIIFENQGFGPPEEARRIMHEAKPYLDAYADALLYPMTAHIGDIMRDLYPHKPHFSFYNPFDPDSFGYWPSDRNPDRPVLAWMGRLEPNKNWRDFLKVGAETAKSVPNVHLWMFTDPAIARPGEPEQLQLLARRLDLQYRITHYHDIPNRLMPDYLSRVGDSGGVLLITSRAESGSYAAAEAISCRCPVVTTDSEGVRSAVVDEATGLYFRHGDIGAGARQVLRLIGQPSLRERLIRQGMARIRTELSMERYAGNFSQMLQALGVGPC
ncbi:glycosyltransferase family 4 protein [Cohnella sp. CFH 77786]|uniref:glycosyltransferase family 4 protein n=1 Tax=Cohnella sp. CFH 77786 TaxID=2662265 RepID=UPI001C60AC11|nr:glycosyltransferase family 4 protein [Cohnella sp. CFH 77786]